MRADNPLVIFAGRAFAIEPLRSLKGLASAHIVYPLAERAERRAVRSQLAALRAHYRRSWPERRAAALDALADMLAFAGAEVPYYRDLFAERAFDPTIVREDPRRLDDLPVLTKDVIREQGERLLARPLAEMRHHACRTGGSTGASCTIYLDQEGADSSSAVALYCRERAGKRHRHPETHLACRFPGSPVPRWPVREDFKCLAMNRSNIFFDRLDSAGLEEMWRALLKQRPVLVHGHPSTLHALARHVEQAHGPARAFDIFESSGEVLEPQVRQTIARALNCRIVNRYGLAELGVVAYELDGEAGGLQVLESEAWPGTRPAPDRTDGAEELVLTGLRNRLMPLVRYATGDLGRAEETESGFVLRDLVGRIHDMVPINGVVHATHHVQDVLDHRVRGVCEFQIDLRTDKPLLRIVPEPGADTAELARKVDKAWPGAFDVAFVGPEDMVRVGRRAKFRHVVTP